MKTRILVGVILCCLCASVKAGAKTPDPTSIILARYRSILLEGEVPGLAERESILPWIAEYSPCALVSAGHPPVCLFYGGEPPAMGVSSDAIHGANFGIGLQQRCTELGVECQVVYPGAPNVRYQTPTDYLIARLK